MGGRSIPDGWLDYNPIGRQIEGTRFVAFKVPLKNHISDTVPNEAKLTCTSLLEKVPNLGMVIDLTNTYRYYDPYEFTKHGVIYKKLMIPGHNIPPEDLVQTCGFPINFQV